MATPDSAGLIGSWTHAHQEDSEGRMVFRPSGWDLPPTRNPLSFDLAQDGELAHASAGPDDRTATTPGTWSLDGDELTLRVEGRPEQRYRVESAEADRLVLRALN